MRKHLIKLQNIENPFEVAIYTTLTGLCKDPELADKNFSYDYLKAYKFPFEYKGYFFDKMSLSKCPAGHKWAGKNIKTKNTTTDD